MQSLDNNYNIDSIIRKVKIYAKRYYAYPFPEETFFEEIVKKCVCDAHGICGNEVFKNLNIKNFWKYSKSQALRYVMKAIDEIEGRIAIPGQKEYYALKLGIPEDQVNAKLYELKSQFENTEDCIQR